MDAVSAGASVLQFAVVALQSIKVLYNTVSGIQNAPQHVQDSASAVYDLSVVLGQLPQTAILMQNPSGYDLKPFEELMKRCKDVIGRFEKDLEKLRARPNEKFGAPWKRIKTLLRKDELEHMRTTIEHYTNTLGIQLKILST